MAYRDKKGIKGLTPVEAGFIRFFEMAEKALKDVNSTYKDVTVQQPKQVEANPRTIDRKIISPFEGGF